MGVGGDSHTIIFPALVKSVDSWSKMVKTVDLNMKKKIWCFLSYFGYKWAKTNKKVTKKWPTTYNIFIFYEILLFCYIYIVGQGAREGGKVGQDD